MRFDFNLARDAPGWADPVIEDGDARLEMTASYMTDALGDLLNALIQLVNGRGEAECNWTQEPAGWQWNFVRPNDVEVELEIRFSDDSFQNGWDPESEEAVRFRSRAALSELVGSIADGARRSLDEFGVDGFAAQWNMHPFPSLQLQALQKWLDDGGEAALYERS